MPPNVRMFEAGRELGPGMPTPIAALDTLSAFIEPLSHDGYVFLAAHPLEPRFTIPGLDIGFFFDLSSDGKAMEFR